MNIERLNILAEWLEAGAPRREGVEAFNMFVGIAMTSVKEECGTVCCLAGATVQFFDKSFMRTARVFQYTDDIGLCKFEVDYWQVLEDAMDLLEISSSTAKRLFEPSGYKEESFDRSPGRAARAIRSLIKQGEYSWQGWPK